MENKLLSYILQMQKQSSTQSVPKLPKAQTGKTMFSPKDYAFNTSTTSNDNIRSNTQVKNEFIRNEEARRIQAERQRLANMPTVRSYDPEKENESLLSRAYHIAVNPMTALSYKVKGRDIPDNFERGEKNILESATSIINPFSYIDAGTRIPGNIARGQFSEAGLNALQALPIVGEIGMLAKEISPVVKGARKTFAATADLPLSKRISNAFNAGTLEMPHVGDVPSHSYYKMSTNDVGSAVNKEIINLPKGAYTVDKNMSKNSAPLFWTQAARNPKEFTIIRSGESQPLNWAGIHGRRVSNALPKDATKYIPEVQEIVDGVKQRADYLRQLGDKKSLMEAARLEKEGVASTIVAELPDIARQNTQAKGILDQFMTNYKPVLDDPIIQVNKNTGLKFPMTSISNLGPNEYMSHYFQPTIHAVKGNPIKDRFFPQMRDYLKNRSKRLYMGVDMPAKPAQNAFFIDNVPGREMLELDMTGYANGGPIVDPMGQWAHPGKVTRIPSANITMQGVPYPVLGVASNGQRQMMYPGKNYSFGGAEHVDEYPMMKGGGNIPQYQFAGAVSSTDSLRHQAAKMMDFEARKGSPTGTGLKNWGYHQSQMPYNMQSPNWKQPTTKDEAVNMYMQEIAPRLQHFPSAMEKGEAGDFLYNTGRDPRVYMLDQYLKSKGQSGIPNRGAYNVDTKTPAWTPQLQQSLNDEWKRNQDDIYKLPVNDRRVLLNKGRDFYYQNINKKADGTPNDSYKATWKPRIWESVNTYKKGGQTDDDREMLSGVADMLRRVNDVNNRKQIAKYMMNNFREEDVTFEPNQFLKSANAFKEGGEMIRRADGSYSRRGLWDNIRANKGSGKKPSKQMLEQERKINSMQGGGQKPIVKYKAINPDDLPHFSQWNPKPGEKEAMAAAFQKQLEDNDKYRDNDGMLESILEFVDPTGVSSWDDVARSFRNPLGSNWDRAFNLFSAIPIVGKIGKGAKAVSVAGKVATKPGVFKKVGNAALKGIDVLTGGPAMRYFDQTINPISRGFGAISGKAVQQIPYSGVRKVWGVGSDFNQMRRFQDGVISPAFNQLDNFMTQPSNNPNKK